MWKQDSMKNARKEKVCCKESFLASASWFLKRPNEAIGRRHRGDFSAKKASCAHAKDGTNNDLWQLGTVTSHNESPVLLHIIKRTSSITVKLKWENLLTDREALFAAVLLAFWMASWAVWKLLTKAYRKKAAIKCLVYYNWRDVNVETRNKQC